MNLTTVKTIGSALVLISALSACKGKSETENTVATATPAAETAPAAAAPEAMPAPAAPEAAPMAIPATADAIWQEINKHSAELKATIDSGSLKEVHVHAFAIRDLVAALPTHSPTLPAADQTKLQGEVQFVTTLADRLDQSGDANDKAGSQANYDKLVTVLNGITRNK